MSKILITGGAGFIGSSLADRLLLSKEHQVVVFDNLSAGKIENITSRMHAQNFEFVRADMLDQYTLEKIVGTCDIVFHLAANPIVALGASDTRIDYEQNLLATYDLLEAMRKSQHCRKLIFTSTSAVYGEANEIPTHENYSPLRPISLYGASKLACEAIICGYCYLFNISCIASRLANIIGPKNRHGVIYDFISKLSHDPFQLDILGNGKQNKSYLYIDDCVDALTLLLTEVGKKPFDIFNVGSDDAITVLEIAELIIRELGLDSVEKKLIDRFNGRGWRGDVKEYWLDCSKLKALGWVPKGNSRDAVINTVRKCLNMRTVDD
jgi:UDP-glucose 4-epimerase